MKKRRRRNKKSSIVYRFTMFTMCCLLCGLLYLINDQEKIITMKQLKNFQLSDITDLMFFNFTKEDEKVSSNVSYQLLKDHYFSNGSNEVNAVFDGVVIKAEKNEVVQLCDNGVSVRYQKMKKVAVKKDERVLKNSVLGSMDESVILRFFLNDKEITLEEAQKVK